ncbi:hypothetical protein [Deinococcus puniceus]|uniref:Uncharacterized protein n=1 Tax=Deinococcus puniceus TaxID=1182568 RepID=A0A172T9I5_9DEIO|nr:hypothetical protein [Deinococcus puniceus]ANE43622.1 hypothetical protein SU48_07385 [Deinococcus puniceus]
MTNLASTHSNDPYREWLRQRLGQEMGVREAEMTIQGAVQRRGWTAVRALGPRDVVAVLQDVYKVMRDQVGEGRADKWLEVASTDLAQLAETVPVPTVTPAFTESAPRALRWGRRAHDLALLLARSHAEIAMRSLGAIRSNPDLSALETAAEWDVQATQAEVRRWETEDMLTNLRADHARVEVADQVAASRAQAELLFLRVTELEGGKGREQATPAQLAHSRLMLTQTTSFLDAFAPLVAEEDADTPLTMLDMNLDNARFSLGVPLHPNVLRARHTLNYAQWQAGEQVNQAPVVAEARRNLAQAEAEAGAQLHAALDAARTHQTALRQLAQTVEALETRAVHLKANGGDPLSLARVRFEWRQARASARIQSHRMEEAIRLLEALVSEPGDFR